MNLLPLFLNCDGGIFQTGIKPSVILLSAVLHSCFPFIALGIPANTLDLAGAVFAEFRVAVVLRYRTKSQVYNPIITSVLIDVINKLIGRDIAIL